MQDIDNWLDALGLPQYAQLFAENCVDLDVLRGMTEADFKEIGVTAFGHRRKLAQAAAILAAKAEVESDRRAAADPLPTAAPHRPSSAERRHLTVMFCDLVGSTALAATLDPEDMREVVRAYQGACAQAIGRYEGFVAQYLGDGVMAYFGYPTAHEDDAERAVRAGLDLIAAVTALDAAALGERGRSAGKIEVRIGIATGLVVVGDLIGEHAAKERAVTGETPNLAARLQGLAAPGSIVVSAATRRLLGGMFDLHVLGPQSLKGLDAPVQAFAVAGARSFESRFEARAGGLTGFVGRDEECEHLLERWKLARQGRGQAVLVSGEAGIGKSRLTAWLVDKAAGEPHTRMRYQCTPHHQDSALYPTIAQIERAAGFEANEGAEAKLAKLEALLTLARVDVAETVPLFAALLAIPTGERYPQLSMSPGQQRQRTLAALLDQVQALARQRPLLMVYEDAHWADATSLELLDSLVDRLARLPVLVVITGRPEFSPTWAGRHTVSTVTLQKLDKRHTRAMVESVTGGAALPAEVLDQIVAKTDGVPLFVEELTKTVLESGALVEDGSSLKATAALPIPATLQDSLMARLDRLNPVKEIAQIGAAIGREFSYKLLLAVAGLDKAAVRTGLAKLEEAELASRRGVPPDETYTFKHALVQEAAYESQLKSRRQVIHRRIANALRDQFAELAEAEPEILAHHFTHGGKIEQAVEWWTKAGESVLRRSAGIEAISHLERAVALANSLPDNDALRPLRLRLHNAYASALLLSRGHAAAKTIDAYSRATELATQLGDQTARFSGLYGIWVGSHSSGDLVGARDKAEAYLREAKQIHSTIHISIGHRLIGSTKWCMGDYAEAISELRRACDLYNSYRDASLTTRLGTDAGSTALILLAMAQWPAGDVDCAKLSADKALFQAQHIGHVRTIMFIHTWSGLLGGVRRDAGRTRPHAEALVRTGNEHGFQIYMTFGKILLGWIKSVDGRESGGLQEIHEGLHVLESSNHFLMRPLFQLLAAEATCIDDPATGLAMLEQNIEEYRRADGHWLLAEFHRCRAKALRCVDAPKMHETEAAFLSAVRLAKAQHARTFELRASLDLARLYCDTGREREAVPLLRGALVGFEPTPELPEIGEAQRLFVSLGGALPVGVVNP